MSTQKNDIALKIISEVKIYKGFRKDKELAEWLGITQNILTNWKSRGIADLSVFTTKGFSEEWLRTGNGEMKSPNITASSVSGDRPNNIAINGHSAHIDIHQANDPTEDYSDPIGKAFLADWMKLPDVIKMRVWTIVKEELDKI